MLPELIKMIQGLIEGGMSSGEAEEIVRRDIESRKDAYEAAKAQDEDDLNKKHGR